MKRYVNLFCAFFLFYSALGIILLPYNAHSLATPLFDVDSIRVLVDMFVPRTCKDDILFCHARVNIHPLFMAVLQPYALPLHWLMGNMGFAALFMGCIAGAGHSVLLYWLLCKAVHHKGIVIPFTLIGGGCFSSVFFSTVPESFVYGGFFLLTYICWLYPMLKDCPKLRMPLSVKAGFLFFGLTSFGITISNYIFYVWGLILFISSMKGTVGHRFLLFVKVNLMVLAGCIIIGMLQWMAFEALPWFEYYGWQKILHIGKEMGGVISHLCNSLQSLWPTHIASLSSEKNYIDFTLTVSKSYEYFSQVLIAPLLAPPTINTGKGLVFSLASPATWGSLLLLFIVIPLCTILKFRKSVWNRGFVFLFGIVAAHLGLHFIYGHDISFLYSFHFLAAFLAVLAISYDNLLNIRGGRFRRAGQMLLDAGGCLLLFNSIVRYMEVVEYCRGLSGIVSPLPNGILPYIIASFALCSSVWLIANWVEKMKKNPAAFQDVLRLGMVSFSGYVLICLPIIFILKIAL